jgi:hypothetical protein
MQMSALSKNLAPAMTAILWPQPKSKNRDTGIAMANHGWPRSRQPAFSVSDFLVSVTAFPQGSGQRSLLFMG